MESEIDVIFTVCHHACCCMICADEVLKANSDPECPQCRAKLILPDYQPIYSELQQQIQSLKNKSDVSPIMLPRGDHRNPTAYALFVRNYCTSHRGSVISSGLVKNAGNAWKELPEWEKFEWRVRAANQVLN